jgi:hypothetical protein
LFQSYSNWWFNDRGNKSITPPNQNLQIFTNPVPNNNISFVKESEPKNDVMNVDIDSEKMDKNEQNHLDSMIRLIKIQPRKGKNKIPLEISFSSKDIIK